MNDLPSPIVSLCSYRGSCQGHDAGGKEIILFQNHINKAESFKSKFEMPISLRNNCVVRKITDIKI
jgi:hypothetical protein